MTRAALFAPSLLLLAVAIGGCSRSEGTTTAAPSSSSTAAPAVALASVDVATHKMSFKPAATYKKGEPASIELVVETKGAYHHNQDFPSRWKAAEGATGITYAQPKLERLKGDASSFAFEPCPSSSAEQCIMRVTVKFTPTQSGKVKVAGELNTGICTKETCLIEKQPLAVEIDVT